MTIYGTFHAAGSEIGRLLSAGGAQEAADLRPCRMESSIKGQDFLGRLCRLIPARNTGRNFGLAGWVTWVMGVGECYPSHAANSALRGRFAGNLRLLMPFPGGITRGTQSLPLEMRLCTPTLAPLWLHEPTSLIRRLIDPPCRPRQAPPPRPGPVLDRSRRPWTGQFVVLVVR